MTWTQRLAWGGGAVALAVGVALTLLSQTVYAAPFSGTLAVRLIDGKLDLDGNGTIAGPDDSRSLLSNSLTVSSIINGQINCGGGFATPSNNGIDAADDCELVQWDGSVITVTDGVLNFSGELLLLSFTTPFHRWATLEGLVDSNGNGAIDGDDCSENIIGSINVLSSDGAINPCTFAPSTDTSMNGKVDRNGDNTITTADDCAACFFGHTVIDGVVQERGPVPTPGPVATATATATPIATPTPVPGCNGAIISGSIPRTAGFGLIVTNCGTIAQVVAASGCATSTMALWATNAAGGFAVYVPGTAVTVVNAEFLAMFSGGAMPQGQALLGKCV